MLDAPEYLERQRARNESFKRGCGRMCALVFVLAAFAAVAAIGFQHFNGDDSPAKVTVDSDSASSSRNSDLGPSAAPRATTPDVSTTYPPPPMPQPTPQPEPSSRPAPAPQPEPRRTTARAGAAATRRPSQSRRRSHSQSRRRSHSQSRHRSLYRHHRSRQRNRQTIHTIHTPLTWRYQCTLAPSKRRQTSSWRTPFTTRSRVGWDERSYETARRGLSLKPLLKMNRSAQGSDARAGGRSKTNSGSTLKEVSLITTVVRSNNMILVYNSLIWRALRCSFTCRCRTLAS